jgi:ABC-type lipoprotein export system ATPase subunit
MTKLEKSSVPLISSVIKDEFILASEKAFDCTFNGESTFYPWLLPIDLPETFNIGVIVGSSGSGKSTLLRSFGTEIIPHWDANKSILSHFESPSEAINRMGAVGLNNIPSWYKSYDVLSNGEKFRADLSRKLVSNSVVDEFTSVVDRNVAKAASVSLSKYIKKNNLTNIVLSTCHRDILDWLEPDWVIDTDTGEFQQGFFLSVQKSKLKFIEQAIISGQCLRTIII